MQSTAAGTPAAGTPAGAANGTTSVNNIYGPATTSVNNNIASGTQDAIGNVTTVFPAASNISGSMRGGNHVVGEVALFVPRKSRTTGVRNVGTQQSVNKT